MIGVKTYNKKTTSKKKAQSLYMYKVNQWGRNRKDRREIYKK